MGSGCKRSTHGMERHPCRPGLQMRGESAMQRWGTSVGSGLGRLKVPCWFMLGGAAAKDWGFNYDV